jgi:large subunit ribosomal protein L32e
MARRKFLRAGYWKYSKLGLRRKKKQVYRKAKGGDNKVRLSEKGRLKKVKIGYRNKKELRGMVKGLKPKMIRSVEELKTLGKHELPIVAHVGDKKRLAIARYALEKKIALGNVHAEKFIAKIEKKLLKKNKKKLDLEKKKEEKEEKVKEKEREEKKETEKKAEEKKEPEKKEPEHAHEHAHNKDKLEEESKK